MASITAGVGQSGFGPKGGPTSSQGLLPSWSNLQHEGMQGINTNDTGTLAGWLEDQNPDFKSDPNQTIYALNQDILSPTNLLPGQRILDDQTQKLINDQLIQATGGGPLNSWLKGTDQSGFNNEATGRQFASSLGEGTDDAFSQALARNNSAAIANSMEGLKGNLEFQATQNQAAQMSQISGELQMNEQLKNQNYQQQYQYMLQRQQMDNQAIIAAAQGRASALNGILGGIGTVAGAAIAALA